MIKKNFLISALLVLAACNSHKKEAAVQPVAINADKVVMTEEQAKMAGIETGSPVSEPISNELKVNGMVDVPPQNIVSVSFPMGGYLRSTKLLPGMHVNRGEVIAVVEDQALIQLQQDYLVAMARIRYLEQEYERQKLLNENKVNADKLFQQAEADFISQKAQVKGLAEKLRLVGITPEKLTEASISRSVAVTSPINGFVSKVNVNIGKYVTPTDVLFELINPDDMHAALTVFEKDITRVKTGQHVKVSFVDDPSAIYDCEVILVTRNVDESRSALVHCHFESKPKNLLPGMFLNATIAVNDDRALTLPEGAVVRYDNKQWVFEATGNNEFTMVEIEPGISANGKIAVQSTLPDFASRKFVIRNAYAILSKMKNTAED